MTPRTDKARVWFTQNPSKEPLFGQETGDYVPARIAAEVERENAKLRTGMQSILNNHESLATVFNSKMCECDVCSIARNALLP